ncbi:hypothetical protein HGM15179_003932 [Zosterops borbonicus]|uniref:Uncharacterized protein n=1 Tax=Zosterops borbonicus TaxID=364589 RepID=A0A8K1GS17_9PASS|nr:hypothetical protein HGM15179_003932 [Zosterops borbonicus]
MQQWGKSAWDFRQCLCKFKASFGMCEEKPGEPLRARKWQSAIEAGGARPLWPWGGSILMRKTSISSALVPGGPKGLKGLAWGGVVVIETTQEVWFPPSACSPLPGTLADLLVGGMKSWKPKVSQGSCPVTVLANEALSLKYSSSLVSGKMKKRLPQKRKLASKLQDSSTDTFQMPQHLEFDLVLEGIISDDLEEDDESSGKDAFAIS